MTPPLPRGVFGEAVDPHIHTSQPDDRDSADLYAECSRLADQVERLKADRRALDIAVTGLRRLQDKWAGSTYQGFQTAIADVTWLLDKIERAR